MSVQVFHKFLLLLSLVYLVNSIGISGKLDFDDKSSLVKSPRIPESLSYKTYQKSSSTSGDFDDIGVVCVSGGCNTTKHVGDKGDVETDVVVHVKTKVNLKNSKIDDTPDIPIVTGYKGTNLETVDDNLNVQPLVITNIDDELNRPQFISSTERNTPYHNIDPYRSTERNFNIDPYRNYNRDPYSTTARSFVPYSNLNPYSTLSPISTTSTPAPYSYSPMYLYGLQKEPHVDLTIQSLPSTANNYDSFNQYNPVITDSDTYRPKFHPIPHPYTRNNHRVHSVHGYTTENGWDRKIPTYHRHTTNGINNCICKNDPGVDQQVFSSENNVRRVSIDNDHSRRVNLDDPGTQINDKLAPLN